MRSEVAMQLERVERAARLLGTSHAPQELLQTLVRYSSADAGADDAMLYTVDEATQALVPSVTIGMAATDTRALEPFAIGEGACGRAALSKAPVVISDLPDCASGRQRDLMERLGARAGFAAPVLGSDGHVLGAIEHHFRQPHRPRDVDLYRVTTYARLVAAVIEHVRFRDQDDVREALALRRRSEIAAVAGELLFSSLDWPTTLDHVARVGLPTLADLCVVSLADESHPLARMTAAHVDLDKQGALLRRMSLTPPSTIEQLVMQTRRRALRPDVAEARAADVDPALRDIFGVRSLMVLPLVAGDRTLGVITFAAAESDRFYDDEELAIADVVAARAAQALEHARVHHRMLRAVRARDELLAIASHDLRNLVSVVKMNCDFLLRFPPTDDGRGAPKPIEDIRRVADRMQYLVRDLLEGATVETDG
jgi:GAF domain-containing protein